MDRLPPSRRTLLLWLLLGTGLLALLGAAVPLYLRHSSLPFLSASPGAEWIVYPKPIEGTRQPAVALTTTFQRTFILDAVPSRASLTLCTFGDASLTLNGSAPAPRLPPPSPPRSTLHALVPPKSDEGGPRSYDLAVLLHPGTNVLTVWVTNAAGPPALWAKVEASMPDAEVSRQKSAFSLATDEHWLASLAGSDYQPARLARRPPPAGPDNPLYESESTLDSLKRAWPVVGALAAVAGLLAFGMRKLESAFVRLRRDECGVRKSEGRDQRAEGKAHPSEFKVQGSKFKVPRSPPTPRSWPFTLHPSSYILLLVLVARAALFLHNAPLLPRNTGFDAPAHEEYVQFILEHHALPLPSDGWEMYQPPLYYATGALLLSTAGYTLADDDATFVLRAINGVAGLIYCWVAFLCLRLLFPDNLPAQAGGLLFAAFLPPQLYLSQYVTNEPLAGLFIAAALYFYLRTLRSNQLWLYAALGASLGAAMLTKVSALIPTVVLAGALGLRALQMLSAKPRGRNQREERIEGGEWKTRASTHPSTTPSIHPSTHPLIHESTNPPIHQSIHPSNPPPSILHPLSAILAFLLICAWHYVRLWSHTGQFIAGNWESGWWQDPGYRTGAFLTGFGHCLSRPLFSAAYSFGDGFYSTLFADGLASGAARVAARPPWNYDLMNAGVVLSLSLVAILLVGLAVAAWRGVGELRFAIHDSRPKTPRSPWSALRRLDFRLWTLDFGLLTVLTVLFFLAVLYMALRVPSYAQVKAFYAFPAFLPLAALFALACKTLAARSPASCSAFRIPHSALLLLLLLWSLTTFAAFWVRPDNPQTNLVRGLYCADHGRNAEAVTALTQALGKDEGSMQNDEVSGPTSGSLPPHLSRRSQTEADSALRIPHSALAEAHLQLGSVLERLNRPADAVAQYRAALKLQPECPAALNNLAWLLATCADGALRNGPEAVRLAERACTLSHHEVTVYQGTLGAAYAEAGRFPKAAAAAEQAVAHAQATHQDELARRNEELLGLYRAGKAFHEAR